MTLAVPSAARCPCRYAPAEAYCPFCDGGAPLSLRLWAWPPLKLTEKVLAALHAERLAAAQPRPGAPNRHERRRARSRRWRGQGASA